MFLEDQKHTQTMIPPQDLLAIAYTSVPAMFTLREQKILIGTHKDIAAAVLPLSDILHRMDHAVRNRNLQRLQTLIAINPATAGRRTKYANVSLLHWACDERYSIEIVRALLAAAPASALTQCPYGKTPLHIACLSRDSPVSLQIIKELLAAAPEAALMGDKEKFLPLHIACMSSFSGAPPSLEIINALLEIAPSAAQKRDRLGFLPLDFAKDERCSPEVLAVLKKATGGA